MERWNRIRKKKKTFDRYSYNKKERDWMKQKESENTIKWGMDTGKKRNKELKDGRMEMN